MPWKKLPDWATGQSDQALSQKLEFVLEENRVYRALLDRHSPHWRLQGCRAQGARRKRQARRQVVGRGHHHCAARNPARRASPLGRQQVRFFQPTQNQVRTPLRPARDRKVGAPVRPRESRLGLCPHRAGLLPAMAGKVNCSNPASSRSSFARCSMAVRFRNARRLWWCSGG